MSHDHAHHDGHDHAGHDHNHGGGGHAPHHHPNYVAVWAVLLVLLALSIAGPMLEIKIVTLITAFGIAFVKAGLVIKYFMHLDTEKPFVHYILITALVFMLLFFAAVAPDVMNHEGTNWSNEAAKAAVDRGLAAGDGHGEAHGGGDAHGGDAHGGGH